MTTMTAALAEGFRTARRAWAVALVLWVWTLFVAGPASMAFFSWLRGQIAYAPEADLLLQRFRFDLFAELARSSEGAVWAAIFGGLFATMALAAIGRAFTTGGLVEALAPGSSGPVMWRFFGGAGRWFLPNLGVLVLNGVAMVAVVLIVSLVAGIAVRPLTDTLSLPLAWIEHAGPIAAAGLVLLFFAIVYDYACIHVARQVRPWRAWRSAVAFVARRLFGAVGLWIVMALLTAVVLLAYLGYRTVATSTTWPLIVMMVAAQQLFIVVRAFLRAALVAAEIRYLPALPAPVVQPEPAVPPAFAEHPEGVDRPEAVALPAPADDARSEV